MLELYLSEHEGDFGLEGFYKGNNERLTIWVNKDGTFNCWVMKKGGEFPPKLISIHEGLKLFYENNKED